VKRRAGRRSTSTDMRPFSSPSTPDSMRPMLASDVNALCALKAHSHVDCTRYETVEVSNRQHATGQLVSPRSPATCITDRTLKICVTWTSLPCRTSSRVSWPRWVNLEPTLLHFRLNLRSCVEKSGHCAFGFCGHVPRVRGAGTRPDASGRVRRSDASARASKS